MAFCPKCGKTIGKTEFCAECSEITVKYKPSVLTYCAICGKAKLMNAWKKLPLEKAVARLAISTIKIKGGVRYADIDVSLPKMNISPGIRGEAIITIDDSIKMPIKIPIKILLTKCSSCSKLGGEYFEGILQIRKPSAELLKAVNKMLVLAKKEGVGITKKVVLSNGIDYYITSAKFLLSAGKKLKKMFGGRLKSTKKLYSLNKQSGKNIYRSTVMFSPSKFKAGDVIVYNKHPLIITSSGRVLKSKCLFTGKKVSIKDDYLSDKTTILKVHKLKPIQTRPYITVLHPETYQPIKVVNIANAYPKAIPDKAVLKIVFYAKKAFVLN